jgi:hypothetical protein
MAAGGPLELTWLRDLVETFWLAPRLLDEARASNNRGNHGIFP